MENQFTAAPMGDRCPRCGEAFRCGRFDTSPCACTTLALSPATLDELGHRYVGCLCLRCLAALASGEVR